MPDRPRVIVALPHPTERAEVAAWLSAEHFEPVELSSAPDAIVGMRARPFDLLIADESFVFPDGLHTKGRARNPLTPAVVIGIAANEPTADATDGRTMYLARPVERPMLICYAWMALLEGRPLRRSARKRADSFSAFVNGIPSRLIDVSDEGLRIEVPPDRRAGLPAYFNVRVPLIGVTISAKRMWSAPSPDLGVTMWYGAALTENRTTIEQAWRSFVGTIPILDSSRSTF